MQEPVGRRGAGLAPHGARREHVRDEASEDVVHADEPQEVTVVVAQQGRAETRTSGKGTHVSSVVTRGKLADRHTQTFSQTPTMSYHVASHLT